MTQQEQIILEDVVAPVRPFYIPASSSILDRRSFTLKSEDTFAVCDHHGDIISHTSSPEGLFHRDTRYLSRYELSIGAGRFLLLNASIDDDNLLLTSHLANPDLFNGEALILSREMMHVVRSKLLTSGACHERIAVHNFDGAAHTIRLSLRFDSDFADIFEVRGVQRAARGQERIQRAATWVLMSYLGLDGITRTTRIDFAPRPTELTIDRAEFVLEIPPQGRICLFFTVRCDSSEVKPPKSFFAYFREVRRLRSKSQRARAEVESSNALLNQTLRRSIADLSMLSTSTPHGPYPYAGIPWFSTPFGRDGIITAMQLMWLNPDLALGVLRYLAATQATEDDPMRDAEPGKIMHEARAGEMANLREVPFGRYYGSVDSTPLFVMLAAQYYERTGDVETVRTLWPNIEAALRWMDVHGDQDRDGFIEYRARDRKGLVNQGWKDSMDSISHADGTLAAGPIALAEVQAYAYAAKKGASEIAYVLGNNRRAMELADEALDLQERFEAAFWCEELGTYALALDGTKQPCRVATSNAGHVLFAGLATRSRAERVMRRLMLRDSFCGWGIRTLAASATRFNPMSYHNGSVWPHDNALIALGFARYGFKAAATQVFEGLFQAAGYMDQVRLPELFCGFVRRPGARPTLYPVACAPQAWASAAPFALLQACLGLVCDHASSEIRFEQPVLPKFIKALIIRRLRLGSATADIELARHGDDVVVRVLARQGNLRVVTVS